MIPKANVFQHVNNDDSPRIALQNRPNLLDQLADHEIHWFAEFLHGVLPWHQEFCDPSADVDDIRLAIIVLFPGPFEQLRKQVFSPQVVSTVSRQLKSRISLGQAEKLVEDELGHHFLDQSLTLCFV